jgi:hypothetical protein
MSDPEIIYCRLEVTEGRDNEPRRRARGASRFKERDITRAFRAAEKAGINARVDITLADGTVMSVTRIGDNAPNTNPWDEILGKPQTEIH